MRNQQSSQNNQTMTTRSRDHSAMASESLSDAPTSGLTSSGLSSALPMLLLLLGLLLLFVMSSEAYDAFVNLPVLFQFEIVAACSLFAFLYAVTIREFRSEWHEKFAARMAGAAGIAMLLAFSFRMTLTVDRLQHQIAERAVISGSSIANTAERNPAGSGDQSAGDVSISLSDGRVVTVANTSTLPRTGYGSAGIFGRLPEFHGSVGTHIPSATAGAADMSGNSKSADTLSEF